MPAPPNRADSWFTGVDPHNDETFVPTSKHVRQFRTIPGTLDTVTRLEHFLGDAGKYKPFKGGISHAQNYTSSIAVTNFAGVGWFMLPVEVPDEPRGRTHVTDKGVAEIQVQLRVYASNTNALVVQLPTWNFYVDLWAVRMDGSGAEEITSGFVGSATIAARDTFNNEFGGTAVLVNMNEIVGGEGYSFDRDKFLFMQLWAAPDSVPQPVSGTNQTRLNLATGADVGVETAETTLVVLGPGMRVKMYEEDANVAGFEFGSDIYRKLVKKTVEAPIEFDSSLSRVTTASVTREAEIEFDSTITRKMVLKEKGTDLEFEVGGRIDAPLVVFDRMSGGGGRKTILIFDD